MPTDLKDWLWRLDAIQREMERHFPANDVHILFTLKTGDTLHSRSGEPYDFPYGHVISAAMAPASKYVDIEDFGLWFDLGCDLLPFVVRWQSYEGFSVHDSMPEQFWAEVREKPFGERLTLGWCRWYYLKGKVREKVAKDDEILGQITDLEEAILEACALAPVGVFNKLGHLHALGCWPTALFYLALKRLHPLIQVFGMDMPTLPTEPSKRKNRRGTAKQVNDWQACNNYLIHLSPDLCAATRYAFDLLRQVAKDTADLTNGTSVALCPNPDGKDHYDSMRLGLVGPKVGYPGDQAESAAMLTWLKGWVWRALRPCFLDSGVKGFILRDGCYPSFPHSCWYDLTVAGAIPPRVMPNPTPSADENRNTLLAVAFIAEELPAELDEEARIRAIRCQQELLKEALDRPGRTGQVVRAALDWLYGEMPAILPGLRSAYAKGKADASTTTGQGIFDRAIGNLLKRQTRLPLLPETKEQPWTDDAPEHLPLTEARKLIDGRKSLSALSKLLTPDGEIRYMRRGRRCKVHIADFRRYMQSHQNDPLWAKEYLEFREAVGKGERRWFWRCKVCGHEYAENVSAPERCPKCDGEVELTPKAPPEPRR